MISASPLRSLLATGTLFLSTSTHFSSPMKGSSETRGIRLPWFATKGRHGKPDVSDGSHDVSPRDARKAIGCPAVRVMSKSVSCQPGSQKLLVPHGLGPGAKSSALQIV